MKFSIFLSAILITWMGIISFPLSFSWKSMPTPPNSAQAECKDISLNLDINGQATLSATDIDDAFVPGFHRVDVQICRLEDEQM